MKYSNSIANIFGGHWRYSSPEERDGPFGVAMFMAYLDGCTPDTGSFARFLSEKNEKGDWDVRARDLEMAFRRLQICGIFSNKNDIRSDPALNGEGTTTSMRTAWCYVAGYSSGFIGEGRFLPKPFSRRS